MAIIDRQKMRDSAIISFLIALLLAAIFASQCSCNRSTVKPDTKVEASVKTALENQQKMSEKIGVLEGDMTKIQTNISNIDTRISTAIDQKFETLQGSSKIGNVEGKVDASHKSNSALYGIGLVGVVLLFALLLIWMLAKVMIKVATKILK